jgi:hypothetical protein
MSDLSKFLHEKLGMPEEDFLAMFRDHLAEDIADARKYAALTLLPEAKALVYDELQKLVGSADLTPAEVSQKAVLAFDSALVALSEKIPLPVSLYRAEIVTTAEGLFNPIVSGLATEGMSAIDKLFGITPTPAAKTVAAAK